MVIGNADTDLKIMYTLLTLIVSKSLATMFYSE